MTFFILVSVGALVISLIAKWLVDMFLHAPIHLVGNVAGLLPTHNPGIAFGVRFPQGVQELLILIALGLVVFAAVRSERSWLGDTGYGLIVGGALGNVLDRVRDGLVTDFFQVGSFAIFNVADSCISIGVALLLAQSLLSFHRNRLK